MEPRRWAGDVTGSWALIGKTGRRNSCGNVDEIQLAQGRVLWRANTTHHLQLIQHTVLRQKFILCGLFMPRNPVK
jgi:hypothetical protein